MLAHDFKVQSGPKQVDNDFGVVSFFPTLDHFSFRALIRKLPWSCLFAHVTFSERGQLGK